MATHDKSIRSIRIRRLSIHSLQEPIHLADIRLSRNGESRLYDYEKYDDALIINC